MTHRLTQKRGRRPWKDAAILAKLYPCLGQGIHNSRDHNIPYMYELTGAPMSALSRAPSRMGVECGSQGWRRLHAANK